jgi:hypothetical protein
MKSVNVGTQLHPLHCSVTLSVRYTVLYSIYKYMLCHDKKTLLSCPAPGSVQFHLSKRLDVISKYRVALPLSSL